MRSVVRRAVGVVITLGVLGGLIATTATPADAAGCQSWKVQPSPNPAGSSHNNVLDWCRRDLEPKCLGGGLRGLLLQRAGGPHAYRALER